MFSVAFGSLDIGQPGQTLNGAGSALTTGHVIRGGEVARWVEQQFPQQTKMFADHMGFGGRLVTWKCTIRAGTAATFRTIENNIRAVQVGATRDASTGLLTAPNPANFTPRDLVDSDGSTKLGKAVLLAPRYMRQYTNSQYAVLCEVEIDFKVLG